MQTKNDADLCQVFSIFEPNDSLSKWKKTGINREILNFDDNDQSVTLNFTKRIVLCYDYDYDYEMLLRHKEIQYNMS